MRLELGLGSGRRDVDGLYIEEGSVEGERNSSSKEDMFNKWIAWFDMEVAVELRTDLALRVVPTVDWDWFLRRNVDFSREWEVLRREIE